MAKKTQQSADAGDENQNETQTDAEDTQQSADAGDEGDLAEEEDTGPKVEALVLSDNIYGKCGEVKAFPADQVEAIAAAGYIDPHPNAVKSARATESDGEG